MKQEVDSKGKAMLVEMIFKEEDEDGREMVTTGKERVLQGDKEYAYIIYTGGFLGRIVYAFSRYRLEKLRI